MKIGIKHFSFIFFLFCSFFIYCQNSRPFQLIDSLNKILSDYDKAHPDTVPAISDTVRIKLLNKLCVQYYKISDNNKMFRTVSRANELCLRLLAMPKYADNKVLKKEFGRTYHHLTNYYDAMGMTPQAFENYFKALKVREELGDLNDIAESALRGGNLYNDEGDLDKALELYVKALTVREKILKNEPKNRANVKGIASGYHNIGSLYQQKGDYNTALQYYFKALHMKESLGDYLSVANALVNIGITYSRMRKYDLALNYTLRALKIYEDYHDMRGECYAHTNIAENFLYEVENGNDPNKNAHIEEAHQHIKIAMEMAKQIRDLVAINHCYKVLSTIAEVKKDFKNSLVFYRLHVLYRDSVNNSQSTQSVVRMEMTNEFERKAYLAKQKQELANAIHEREHARQKTLRNLFMVAFACMLILALFIYRNVKQKQKDNNLITEQKKELEQQKVLSEQKQKQIIDSINYAQRIQSSILPHPEDLRALTKDSFIYYSPRDIVSGDFYWLHRLEENKIMIAVADCTGHGVPGAFLSMVGSTLLSEIVVHKHITDPAQVIKELSYGVSLVLINKEEDEVDKDGMDVTIAVIDNARHILTYASANQCMYATSENRLLKLEPQIHSAEGIFDLNGTASLVSKEVQLKSDSVIYLLSDGCAEQTNHAGDKFCEEQLEELFSDINSENLQEQRNIIADKLSHWRGQAKQVDDILILGIRI